MSTRRGVVTEYGYRYRDYDNTVGPVPEWEARGRALCDSSVAVYARPAGMGAQWYVVMSPGPDALPFKREFDLTGIALEQDTEPSAGPALEGWQGPTAGPDVRGTP
jgi:hypothetical protein